jgi:2-oxoglutarate dehydrogenase E2 component (dihydrolipoamide succinyltransferase)
MEEMNARSSAQGIEIRVPTLPESVSDATLVAWHKQPGDTVRRDENLVDIETDKVVFEVPSPEDGILKEIQKHDGDTVLSDELIAIVQPQAAAKTAKPEQPPTNAEQPEAHEQPLPALAEAQSPLSPAVRHLIAEYQLDPQQIDGTGEDGRLTKADVLKYLEARKAAAPKQSTKRPAAERPATMEAPPPTPGARGEAEEPGVRRVTMNRLRARIAERMVEAQQTAAILTTFNEINMQSVLDMRRQYRDRFEQRHGVKLGLMSFFVRACVEALRRFPIINASVEDSDILYHDYYDIGIAVSSPRGLVVPVLRDADRLSFAEIETSIAAFSKGANEGSLTIEELTGGTFTITNGGIFGSLMSTPIVNPPQSAILGMHKIQERPVAEDGEVRIRPMMYVALSYDHRIIDGRDAVQFLVAVKEILEDPARLLLEI